MDQMDLMDETPSAEYFLSVLSTPHFVHLVHLVHLSFPLCALSVPLCSQW